jgi:ribonuclease HI
MTSDAVDAAACGSSSVITVYTDGASLGNPGPAGAGAVFIDADGRVVARVSKYLGETTNNVAEYLALVYALQEALRRGFRRLVIKADSELMIRQLSGEYQVRDGTLRLFYDLAQSARRAFDLCTFEHIGRSGNAEADRLAGQAAKLRRDPEA